MAKNYYPGKNQSHVLGKAPNNAERRLLQMAKSASFAMTSLSFGNE